jgi:hypothetical protein
MVDMLIMMANMIGTIMRLTFFFRFKDVMEVRSLVDFSKLTGFTSVHFASNSENVLSQNSFFKPSTDFWITFGELYPRSFSDKLAMAFSYGVIYEI